jgi:hypothetical protein
MIEGLISFVFEGVTLIEKILFIFIFLTVIYSSYIFFKSNKYLQKTKFYFITYFIQLGIFILLILVYLLSSVFNFLVQYNVNYFTIGIYFIIFFISTLLPLIRYGRGIIVFSQPLIRIPNGGTNLEFSILNKTPLDDEIDIKLNLPENILLHKKKSRKFVQTKRVLGKRRIFINVKVRPIKHNLTKKAFLKLESNLIGKKEIGFKIKT